MSKGVNLACPVHSSLCFYILEVIDEVFLQRDSYIQAMNEAGKRDAIKIIADLLDELASK